MTTYGIDRSLSAGGTGSSTTALLADGSQPLTADWDTGQYGVLVGGKLALTNIISPAAISTPTHNWAPTGFADAAIIRLTASAASSITGLAGGTAGRTVYIHNVSGYDITFVAESGSSSAANRFAITEDTTLRDKEVALLQYDSTASRWRVLTIGTPGNNTVSTAKLQDASVTNAKLQDASVTNVKLQDASVTNVKLQDASVTPAKLANNSAANTYPRVAAGGATFEFKTPQQVADELRTLEPSPLTFKNAIMNGAFEVWQRGTSFTAVASGDYTADRWQYGKTNSTAVHTINRSTDVPTVAEAGRLFNYSMLVDCTTADTSIAANEVVLVQQRIEGFVWRRYAQRNLTLSFWVKATKTGIYCVALQNSGGDRSFVAEYTINTTNTWEKKTISITASPSTGTWDYTTGIGAYVRFSLAGGSNFHTTAGSWQTGNFLCTSNQVNACDDAANDFRLAAVQLEVGSTETAFEDVPYEIELHRCRRYFQRVGGDAASDYLGVGFVPSTSTVEVPFVLHPPMRVTPSVTGGGSGTIAMNDAGAIVTINTPPVLSGAVNHSNRLVAVLLTSGSATLTAGRCARVYSNSTTAGVVNFSAEL